MGRALAGFVLGLVARVWLWSLRVTVVAHPSLEDASEEADSARAWVLAFWHGTQFPLLAWKRRAKTAVMVSLSKDGAIQARALARLGMSIVRGSSSRRGALGLRDLVVRMRRHGEDAAFAVDGPRGPRGVAKPGAAIAARLANARVVPLGAHAARAITLEKAWDRYVLPLPFTRVRVVLGAPLEPEEAMVPGVLDRAIDLANANAA